MGFTQRGEFLDYINDHPLVTKDSVEPNWRHTIAQVIRNRIRRGHFKKLQFKMTCRFINQLCARKVLGYFKHEIFILKLGKVKNQHPHDRHAGERPAQHVHSGINVLHCLSVNITL